MKIRQSKGQRIVVLTGILLMLVGGLLYKMHMPGSTMMMVVARILLLVSCVQLLLSPFNNPRYFSSSAGISMTSLNAFAGILLLLPGVLRVVGGWHGRYMSMAGLVLFIIGFLWGIVRVATSKSRHGAEASLSDEQLAAFSGSFINLHLGMRINVELQGQKLIAQAEGQPMIALQPVGNNALKGTYVATDIRIEYDNEHDGFVLKQNGGVYPFERMIAG